MKTKPISIIIICLLVGAVAIQVASLETNLDSEQIFEKINNDFYQPPQPPVAAFNFTPTNPMINEKVVFDASDSYYPQFDPEIEVEIIDYRWDLTGDGVFDDATGEIIEWSWSEEGIYLVTLKVVGNIGLNNTMHQAIEIHRPTELSIGTISAENGRISVEINNIGEGYSNIDWKITTSGGILNLISHETTGNWVLESGDGVTVKTDRNIWGFGFININVEADALNAEKVNSDAEGIILGTFIILL